MNRGFISPNQVSSRLCYVIQAKAPNGSWVKGNVLNHGIDTFLPLWETYRSYFYLCSMFRAFCSLPFGIVFFLLQARISPIPEVS